MPKSELTVIDYQEIAEREDKDSLIARHSLHHSSKKLKTVLENGLRPSKLFIHAIALATTISVLGVNFGSIQS